MYQIEFYSQDNGFSPIEELMDNLQDRALTNKDARIQWKQLVRQLEDLSNLGREHLPTNITKHIEDDIWELRPGRRRILYFFYKDGIYVMLHSFIKKTQKTPRREIEKAKRERDDYLRRKG